jgi:transcriptional regulator with XRE-family HTH domain
MLTMDWRRVRETLRDLRLEKKIGPTELADDAGIAKTTVYRIEDVNKDPDKEMDLETIEKLTAAMDVPLSVFFARVEGITEAGTVAGAAFAPDLDPDARQLGLDLALALDKHLRAARRGAPPHGSPGGGHTKSGPKPRR